MTRFLSIVCLMSVIVVGLAEAQAQAQVYPNHRPRRPPPQMDPSSPDRYSYTPAAAQNAPFVAPQQPPAQPPRNVSQVPLPMPTPSPAPEPPMPENLPPPTPPEVTYSNGLLTVQAMNSTLGGLLLAIHNKTGIQFEGWEAAANERVVVSMGPAPEGEVLAAILGGSKFDYVVLDRPDSPGTVQRVLLTPRTGVPTTAAGAQPARPANAQGEAVDEDALDEQAAGDPEPQDTPARPPLSQVQLQQAQPNPTPKTPEQLMEELKQMEQRQQQQQQLLPQNQAPIKPPIPRP